MTSRATGSGILISSRSYRATVFQATPSSFASSRCVICSLCRCARSVAPFHAHCIQIVYIMSMTSLNHIASKLSSRHSNRFADADGFQNTLPAHS